MKQKLMYDAAQRTARTLRQFIGPAELSVMLSNVRGEEGEFFAAKLEEIARIVSAMPKTGETDGQGGAAVAHLRYFAGGRAACYITERDVDTDGAGQCQAFGLADLFGDGGELGYISLVEWLENGAELDLYYTPQTLDSIRARHAAKVGAR